MQQNCNRKQLTWLKVLSEVGQVLKRKGTSSDFDDALFVLRVCKYDFYLKEGNSSLLVAHQILIRYRLLCRVTVTGANVILQRVLNIDIPKKRKQISLIINTKRS